MVHATWPGDGRIRARWSVGINGSAEYLRWCTGVCRWVLQIDGSPAAAAGAFFALLSYLYAARLALLAGLVPGGFGLVPGRLSGLLAPIMPEDN
jgi:hypothetical protein